MVYVTLHNGVKVPQLGFGTWFIDDDKAAEAVRQAVGIGYRHIDTAQAYGKENAKINFCISDEDIEYLSDLKFDDTYGEFSVFPVFSGK